MRKKSDKDFKQRTIQEIYLKAYKLGRTPYSKELTESQRSFLYRISPDHSIANGLKEIGLEPLTLSEMAKIRKTRSDLKWRLRTIKLYFDTGKVPTRKELEYVYGKAHISSFTKIIKQVFLKPVNEIIPGIDYTRDELINKYIELCNALGKAATFDDIKDYRLTHPSYPNPRKFLNEFYSFENLRMEANIENRRNSYYKYSSVEMKNALLKINEIHGDISNQKELEYYMRQFQEFKHIKMNTIFRYFKVKNLADLWRVVRE